MIIFGLFCPLCKDVIKHFFYILGCGKLFVEEQQLDVHFKHHENYTPRTGKHKCHLCKEAFFQKDMLKRHVLSTHNEVSSFRSRGKQPSKSRRHCHTATSLKGGLISEGFFHFGPIFAKVRAKLQSSSFELKFS